MSDSNISFVLDLDGKEFAKGIAEAKEHVQHLVEVFKEVGISAGIVGAAVLALKTSLDLTLEAENIKAINEQFERLTENAGIATETLKEGLEKAAHGLIDDTELLKAANKSIIEMRGSAAQLPEILELARKATAAFGGDLLHNFEAMNQAIATGSTRHLKQLGIIIDQDKALRTFANSLGITVSAMSDAEKKQAILNAVLERGKVAFDGVDPSIKKANDSWTQLKVTLGQLGEATTLAGEKLFGNFVRKGLDVLNGMAGSIKNGLTVLFGNESEKAAVKVASLTNNVGHLERQLSALQNTAKNDIRFTSPEKQAEIQRTIDQTIAKIKERKAEIEALEKSHPKPAEKESTPELPKDNEKRLLAEAKFNRELLQFNKQRVDAEAAAAQSIDQADLVFASKRVFIVQDAEAQIAEIKAKRASGEIATDMQASQIIEQIENTKKARLFQNELELNEIRNRALDNYLAHSRSTAEGVSRAFEVGSKKAAIAQADFGAVGARVFKSFESNSVSALQAFGAGTKSASDAAKGFLFGMLGDEAEARGKLMLLASIWPPNPVGLAAGAGLIALSGFLKAQAGGSSGGSIGGGAVGGGSGYSGSVGGGSVLDTPQVAEQQKKSVNLIIQGHVFNDHSTSTWLAERIREAQDATDISIKQVGQ